MLLFETIGDLWNLFEHLEVRDSFIDFQEILPRDLDTRIQQSLLIEQVDEVVIQLGYTLTEVHHVIAVDCVLILRKLQHFKNHLAHLFWFLILEYDIAHQEILEAHAIDLRTLLPLVPKSARSQSRLTGLVQENLALDGNLRCKDTKQALRYDLRHLRPQNFYAKDVFVDKLQQKKVFSL